MAESEVDKLLKENERLKMLVSSLENQLAWLRKKVFGSMSEKHLPLNPPDELQLSLLPDQMSVDEKAKLQAEAQKEEAKLDKLISTKSEKPSRKPVDTTKLPVKEEHFYPEGINGREYTELALKLLTL